MKYLLFVLLIVSCTAYPERWRAKCIENDNIILTDQPVGYEIGDTIIDNAHHHILLNKVKR